MLRTLPGVQDYYNRKGLVDESGKRKKAFDVLKGFYESDWGAVISPGLCALHTGCLRDHLVDSGEQCTGLVALFAEVVIEHDAYRTGLYGDRFQAAGVELVHAIDISVKVATDLGGQ